MKRKNYFLLIVCCIFTIQIPGLYANDPTPEQLVADHLKSIGEPDAMSQIKSIKITGISDVNFIQGMQGNLTGGKATIVSQGAQMGLSMKFGHLNYPEEHFAYDGKSVSTATIHPGHRTPIAEFIRTYNKIMKNGMLGGVFSNAWPLLDVKSNKPTMRNLRKTKVDDTELYELEYRPRDNHGDMRIRLYFDPETSRHLRTEYRIRIQGGVAMTGIMGNTVDTYYTLTEKFADFKKAGDLTLPHSYTLDYSSEGDGAAFIANWKINAQEIVFNPTDIDQSLYKAE